MLLVLLGSVLMLGCDQMFYYPNNVWYGAPEQYRLTYESVTFAPRKGPRLHGWFFPAQPSTSGPATQSTPGESRPPRGAAATSPAGARRSANGHVRGTILHLHGNAGNVTGHFHHVAWLPPLGWNVLCFDYRGYGQSKGSVTRAGTIADAKAALDYLLTRDDVDPQGIVAFGQSLGGAIGIVLAAEREEVRGLAVDGAFDNYRQIASWHIHGNPLLLPIAWWVPKMLMTEGYDPIDYVAKVSPRPVFIMHGTADQVVDPRMARRLYEAAAEPKELWMVDGADHYGAILEYADVARPKLLNFFNRCVEESPRRH